MGGKSMESSGCIVFEADDEAYLAWLASHPKGFVLNSYRPPSPDYLVIHRASCSWMRELASTAQYHTVGYIKVCADKAKDIHGYALASFQNLPTPCSQCHPYD
jgi:hypothetical protein